MCCTLILSKLVNLINILSSLRFGESLDERVTESAQHALATCDLFLVVGTSAVVYPAAGYIPLVVRRGGAHVVEVNLESTGNSGLLL